MIDPASLDPAIRAGIAALAAEMGEAGVDRDDPARSVMALLGDRWSSLILLVLATGEWRHADLRRITAQLSSEKAISQRVLTLKLRGLERDGFVHRRATTDVPPKVSYRLSTTGVDLVEKLRWMLQWLNGQRAQILAARQQFDSGEQGSC